MDLAAADESWTKVARQIQPNLWKQLEKIKHTQASLFDTYSDLTPGELLMELEELLGRTALLGESRAFREMVLQSAVHAKKKQRFILSGIREPWRIVQTPVVEPIFSEREVLVANRTLRGAQDYPTASSRKTLSKDEVRDKLVRQVWKIVEKCMFPAVEVLRASVAPDRLLLRFGSGKRTGTLKEKVRSFGVMSKWMEAVFNKPFPTMVSELADYILERGSEPCGPTVPASILGMINYFEEIGCVSASDRLGKNGLLKALTDDLRLELVCDVPKPKQKANQLLICQVAAWEIIVCDSSYFTTVRLSAWVKLMKVWACLRTSDLAGIPQNMITLVQGGLRGQIHATKTTGAGKSVGVLYFVISAGAYIVKSGWLDTGFRLFTGIRTGKSFILPLPTKDRETYSDKEPSFAQWVTGERKLLSDTLTIDQVDDDLDEEMKSIVVGKEVLLVRGIQVFWAGHGDRSTLPSWLAALNYSKLVIDVCGRWRPSEGAEYIRTSEETILRVQSEVASSIREAGVEDVCMERGLLNKLATFSTDRGVTLEETEAMLTRINESRLHCSLLPTGILPAIGIEEEEPGGSGDEDGCEVVPVVLSLGVRVISITKGGTSRTLHKVGECWRRPGVHYKFYIVPDEDEVGEYRHLCKDCYPKQIDPVVDAGLAAGEESSDSSDSESDSSTD